jgi:hypothetical protein
MARRPTRDPHFRPAISALERLHSELGGEILENKAEAKRLAANMVHVEAVLKMLQPGYDVRPIAVKRRQPNPWFKRGTLYRRALDVLRTATEPLTAKEIVLAVLAAAKVSDPGQAAIRDLAGGINASLRNHRGDGVHTVGAGIPARWLLSPDHGI